LHWFLQEIYVPIVKKITKYDHTYSEIQIYQQV
jgi:hypothetical protein